MTQNQFWYTRKEVAPASKDSAEDVKVIEYLDSFNLEEVLRTVQNEDGTLLVALKDGHEESRQVGWEPAKGKSAPTPIKARIWVQSRITLEGADVARYRNISKCCEYEENLGVKVVATENSTGSPISLQPISVSINQAE